MAHIQKIGAYSRAREAAKKGKQGATVQYKNDDTYKLICKDGPVFNIQDIQI